MTVLLWRNFFNLGVFKNPQLTPPPPPHTHPRFRFHVHFVWWNEVHPYWYGANNRFVGLLCLLQRLWISNAVQGRFWWRIGMFWKHAVVVCSRHCYSTLRENFGQRISDLPAVWSTHLPHIMKERCFIHRSALLSGKISIVPPFLSGFYVNAVWTNHLCSWNYKCDNEFFVNSHVLQKSCSFWCCLGFWGRVVA
jgi:hypothetical protein